MTTIIYPACALFAWFFVLSGARRFSTMRRERERLPLWLMFLAFALVFTVGSSPLRRHLDGFAGVTEFSTWLAQSLVVAYSVAAVSLLQEQHAATMLVKRARIRFNGLVIPGVVERPDVGEYQARQVTGGDFLHDHATDSSIDPPETGGTEVEVPQGELDREVIVEQPQAGSLRNGLPDRRLADRRRAHDEQQYGSGR